MPEFSQEIKNEWHNAASLWDTASDQWKDRKAVEFIKEYWSKLDNITVEFCNNLDDLARALEVSRQVVPDK